MRRHKIDYSDKDLMKQYILSGFKRKGQFKGVKLYKLLIKLYNIYPQTIKEIIDNLDKITYYKDYFRLLSMSKNEELNEYIYNLIETRVQIEFNNGKATNLSKWLPRERSHYDKKLGFVTRICKKLYPKINIIEAKKQYRQQLSKMNKQLDIVEVKLSSKQYDEINVNNMTRHSLIKYNNILCSNPKLKTDLSNHYYDLYNKCDYLEFMGRVMSFYKSNMHTNDIFKLETDIIIDCWNRRKHYFVKKYEEEFDFNNILVVNATANIINRFYKQFIMVILLFLEKNGEYIINSNNPKLIKEAEKDKDNIFQKVTTILSYINSSDKLQISKINNLTTKTLTILTDQEDIILADKLTYQVIDNMNYIIIDENLFPVYSNHHLILIKNILDKSKELDSSYTFIQLIVAFIMVCIFIGALSANWKIVNQSLNLSF
jgi:hypothetical protein